MEGRRARAHTSAIHARSTHACVRPHSARGGTASREGAGAQGNETKACVHNLAPLPLHPSHGTHTTALPLSLPLLPSRRGHHPAPCPPPQEKEKGVSWWAHGALALSFLHCYLRQCECAPSLLSPLTPRALSLHAHAHPRPSSGRRTRWTTSSWDARARSVSLEKRRTECVRSPGALHALLSSPSHPSLTPCFSTSRMLHLPPDLPLWRVVG